MRNQLREFLHYGVLLRRATLPYEVPLVVLPKLILGALRSSEAKLLVEKVRGLKLPLLFA